jgi:ubiquinone/menaquinone biosynthesis C-methylase UbiE
MPSTRYVHALTFRRLTPLYDPLVRLTAREMAFKRRLVAEANLQAGQRVLDVGAGTGTLALMLKAAYPAATVIGVDGDEEILALAREKATSRQLDVSFAVGLAGSLAFEPASFDLVVSSLVFHHLTPDVRTQALTQVLGLLRPGARFLLADLGGVPAWMARSVFLPTRLLDGRQRTADNYYGRLPGLLRDAGFAEVRRIARYRTPVGPIEILGCAA